MVMKKKKSCMGRQKITIEKIKKKSNLQVTFSKRRAGLFKKASELCTLCGVEIAIVVFSPAGKVFSFGHPDVDSIANQYLSRNRAQNGEMKCLEGRQGVNIYEMNSYLSLIQHQLEFERKRGEELDHMKKDGKSQYWWESPIDELGINELHQLRNAMVELHEHVDHITTIPNNFGH